MKKYRVTFVQYNTYDVDAENEAEAENVAGKSFADDMKYPCTRLTYDDCVIEDVDRRRWIRGRVI